MPSRPIDPELFAKAMESETAAVAGTPKPGAKSAPAASGGVRFDPARIRDALRQPDGKEPQRMSLGVRPAG
jgi:hypothetical protein